MALLWCFLVLFVVGSASAKSVTIHGVTLSSDYSITGEQLLGRVTKSLVEYDKNLDSYINWVDFDNMFKEMLDVNGPYSVWNIGDIRKFFLKSRDLYFDAVTAVYEWCGQITILMKAYVELLNDYSPDVKKAQKEIIVYVLEEGIKKMSDALKKLDESREHINTGVVGLTDAIANISAVFRSDENEHNIKIQELSEASTKWYNYVLIFPIIQIIVNEVKLKPEAKAHFENIKLSFDFMKTKLKECDKKASEISEKLRAEIQSMVELRAAAESNKMLITLPVSLKNAANTLITKSSEYQVKHGLKV